MQKKIIILLDFTARNDNDKGPVNIAIGRSPTSNNLK
jgi:hypothetical protein